ncbi:hypothetical protein [Falsirhodobacter sp. 20TX0035]|uniref:hypothetical protein n=1 Tax=Falsirhodobacter sp. 20TX0035 TaxID=3022019 RepID=UPI00232EFFF8|nr:hypothetical protein [Falsirhodobacter sp. 20TX0035]MDB6453632.1 hypothetical protein [Falsirhodobacter sp. 20TX0035]
MNDLGKIGFITMAFGADKYFHQAESLARSLRRHMPEFPIAIVTDRKDAGALFDICIPIDPFQIAGTLLKADLYRYSPFEETFFIDTDCIVAKPFHDQLRKIRQFDFSPVVSKFLSEGDTDLWIRDVGKAIKTLNGSPFPKFNGGVYFFRQGPHAEKVFSTAHAINARRDELGILNFDKSGPGEETLFGLALSQMHATELYDDGGQLMRTPLNSQGPVHLDVIEGTSGFIKEGQHVSPAICHFCGEWFDHPVYLIAQEELVAGRNVSRIRKNRLWASYKARGFKSRVVRKLNRLLAPRIAHLLIRSRPSVRP